MAKEKAGKCRATAALPSVVTLACPSVPARRESATSRMSEFGLDLAEQPVHVDDREGLALVTRMVPVTVEADEAAG